MNKVTTPVARLSFPAIWDPQGFTNNDGTKTEPKFAATLLFPKDADLSALKKLAFDTMAEKWPKGIPSGFKSPFRSGDEKPDLAGYPGTVFVKASSSRRPKIVDLCLQEILDRDQVYAGCYVRASVNCYAYDQRGNRGVAFGLLNLQKIRDGESFGGTSRPEDDFFDSDKLATQQGGESSLWLGANAPAASQPNDPFDF